MFLRNRYPIFSVLFGEDMLPPATSAVNTFEHDVAAKCNP